MSLGKFYEIRSIMEKAFSEGKFEEAKNSAIEYLEIAESKRSDWNYGNAIHHANLMLGRISLKEGLKEKAKEYLISAGKTPGSPQLNSFGPNMSLAKELLEIGEDKIVIEYIELCEKFWKRILSRKKLMKWKRAITKSAIPNFKGNLIY